MNIETGSKWQHKDGGVYEVVDVITTVLEATYIYNRVTTGIVWYKDQQGEIYVRTEREFLENFKPYKEPVYEYRWAYLSYHDGLIAISDHCTEEDIQKIISPYTKQRLDFTKRERKQ